MPRLPLLSPSQQVARHLREELQRGVWKKEMPGIPYLAAELGLDAKTVVAALRLLEEEGILEHQGNGRRRRIVELASPPSPSLRLAILLGEAADGKLEYMTDLQYRLRENGHSPFFLKQSMVEMGMDVQRIARTVERTDAAAWIVLAGSREVLEWFSARPIPAFALFGRRRKLPIPGVGPDMPTACAAATRELIGLGHRRIVMLVRPRRRLPQPGTSEQAFLDELARHSIPTSEYNLPAWDESIHSFHARLESLFRVTPPTAMIIDEVPLLIAVQQFLAWRRLRVPIDVSLISTENTPALDWCQPAVAHIRWESAPIVRRVLRWADNVSNGKSDLRHSFTPAKFVPGGTIGPAPER